MTTRPRLPIGFRARATDHLAVAVGTVKGLFIVSDGVPDGPWFKGQHVPAFLQIGPRYLAATVDARYGPMVHVSVDSGTTWTEPTGRPIAFPEGADASVAQIWQLHLDQRNEDSDNPVVLAGVEPAALFRSADLGDSFELVEPLWSHPHRERWEPGGGGLGLHTVLTHPQRPDRIIVGISAGGVYRSDDGGANWSPRNVGIGARHLPEPDVEFGQCVHKIAIDAEGPDVLWLQNHWGVYRSTDAGDSWEDLGRPGELGGLPSDFGFPIVAHPDEPGTAFVFPLESDEYRCSPGGSCRVYRTADAGKTWEALGDGLPPAHAHLTVLRDAFTIGGSAPFQLVFGTRTGQVYSSADGGEHWRLFADHLPPILSVRVLD
ncbi:MAG: WD40/YVTN/BNR-like repeat-containing protein [Acidimicrobiales bacterium]|jgi:hypothetical protein